MSDSTIIQTLELPEINAATRADWNRVVGSQRVTPVAIAGEAALLSFSVAEPQPPGPLVHIASPVGHFWLSLTAWADVPGVAETLGEAEIERLPLDLWPAALAASLEALLDELSQLTGGPWELLEVTTGAAPSDTHPIGVRIQTSAGTTNGVLVSDHAGLAWLAGLLPPTTEDSPGLLNEAVLSIDVEIGMTLVPVEELAALRKFDLLVVDTIAPEGGSLGIVRIGNECVWRVSRQGETLTLVKQFRQDTPETPGGNAQGVRVLFKRGVVDFSIRGLGDLTPGSVFPVRGGDRVAVTVGAQTIGFGDLVSIAGHTAIRLSEVLTPS